MKLANIPGYKEFFSGRREGGMKNEGVFQLQCRVNCSSTLQRVSTSSFPLKEELHLHHNPYTINQCESNQNFSHSSYTKLKNTVIRGLMTSGNFSKSIEL